MSTADDLHDTGWLAEQATAALDSISNLYDEAMAGLESQDASPAADGGDGKAKTSATGT
ncbi:hypothetical protein [Prauserella cavernicola]|uniref:Uncharacterized protein n=1 Tax=Prauserella cavernicola TaxID=2800127 RepID=A0A934V2T8_9PSEU|nr:hypothetical protein [Prauserella cavernicola]MBK1783507.1 hypothetical protein [Prauserella cavernicola]